MEIGKFMLVLFWSLCWTCWLKNQLLLKYFLVFLPYIYDWNLSYLILIYINKNEWPNTLLSATLEKGWIITATFILNRKTIFLFISEKFTIFIKLHAFDSRLAGQLGIKIMLRLSKPLTVNVYMDKNKPVGIFNRT